MTKAHDRKVLAELCRGMTQQSFPFFIRQCFRTLNPGAKFMLNWHILAIAHQLDRVRKGEIRRLIITMPPRSLKSICVTVGWPAYMHGLDPTLRFMCASYGQDLSVSHHNDYRKVLGSPWYQSAFPQTRIDRTKNSESEVLLTRRGRRLATSVGGVVTGKGADIIIIDDPLKATDAHSESMREAMNKWFSETLLSRLNSKKTGAIVIVTQRLHAHDLVGHVLDIGGDDWTVLNLPAIAQEDCRIPLGNGKFHDFRTGDLLHPEREGMAELDALRRELGSEAFQAQYLQEPIPPGGNMFKREWLHRYRTPPQRSEADTVIQSWDTASKTGPENDWSVCTTWLYIGGLYYLLHVFRDKLDYPRLRTKAISLAQEHRPTQVLVEDAGIGTALAQELRPRGFNVHATTPKSTKEARAAIQAAKFEGGRVLFPEKAPWLNDLEAELLAFPGGRHDDQVDSIAQALAYKRQGYVTTTVSRVRGLI